MTEQPTGDDPFQDPAWLEYAEDVKKRLVPMVKGSPLTMALYSGGDPDPKQAIEFGYMILLNKPIILTVTPGATVPDKVARVADEIVEADFDDPEGTSKRIQEACARVAEKFGLGEE